MAFDWRYNLKHIGDIFTDSVHKTADTATQCSKRVFLAYDIKLRQRMRDRISGSIGERVTCLIKEGVTDFTKDATLSEQIGKLNSIEHDISEFENIRSKLVFPFKAKKDPCECTTNCK